jgi:shikimate kinase
LASLDSNYNMDNKQVIALIGLSGVGKSSVGRLLAQCLGCPLTDTDALIADRTGRTIPDIFAAEGEVHFRELESAALAAALSRMPSVVATGAGIVLRPENRARLRDRALVAWLDAPTDALVARLLAHDEARPLLQGADPATRLEALRQARGALYAEVADVRIATDGRTVAEIAEAILQAFDRYNKR